MADIEANGAAVCTISNTWRRQRHKEAAISRPRSRRLWRRPGKSWGPAPKTTTKRQHCAWPGYREVQKRPLKGNNALFPQINRWVKCAFAFRMKILHFAYPGYPPECSLECIRRQPGRKEMPDRVGHDGRAVAGGSGGTPHAP